MAQEGRLLAAAIEARDRFDGEDAQRILVQLGQRHLARFRVVSLNGEVVADSALLGPRLENGEAAIDGSTPVNTSGGLKSKGHPVGATGVAQIVEITEQLTGQSGERQLEGARRGLAQNMGGSGGSCTVHILEVEQ